MSKAIWEIHAGKELYTIKRTKRLALQQLKAKG